MKIVPDIDKITAGALTALFNSSPSNTNLQTSYPGHGYDLIHAVENLIKADLAIPNNLNNDPYLLRISAKGIEVEKAGGYLKWVAYQRKIKAAEESKIILDAAFSKWQVKVFWALLVITTVGAIISIVNELMTIFKTISTAIGESQIK